MWPCKNVKHKVCGGTVFVKSRKSEILLGLKSEIDLRQELGATVVQNTLPFATVIISLGSYSVSYFSKLLVRSNSLQSLVEFITVVGPVRLMYFAVYQTQHYKLQIFTSCNYKEEICVIFM